MKMVAVVMALGLTLAGTAACSGDENKARSGTGGTGAPAPVPAAKLTSVTLPDQPGPLVDVVTRQVRRAGTVRAEYVSNSAGGSRAVKEKISAQLRTGVRPPSAQLTIVSDDPADAATTEAVIVNGVIYTRVDGQEQAPGKPWARLSRQDARNPEIAPFHKMLSDLISEVEKSLAELSTDAGLMLVRNGTFKGAPAAETLQGVRVRRYSGATEPSNLSGADPAVRALSELGLKQVAWVLWVDEKGLPRKFQVNYTTPQQMRAAQTVTYSRWGEPVLIQAPPANKVHTIGA
jgi:hypothetical protein